MIDGGTTRQESVFNGLKSAKNETVVIHEAARPFATIEDFNKLISNDRANIIYGKDIPFTVLDCENGLISGLLERNRLVNVKLPQKYKKECLLKAHIKAKKEDKIFTEDASLLFYYENIDISILEGKDYNIKLTSNLDLIIAEEIYKEYMVVNNEYLHNNRGK